MKKKLYIEFLRVFAILLVVFNHTGDTGYQLYVAAENPAKYILYGMISSLCKTAVPIFFMISGALLLSKEETIQTVWKKRIAKTLVILLAISLFYYVRRMGFDFTQFDIGAFVQSIYTDCVSFHLWYLYAYVAFLILLPFLRKLVKNLSEQDYKYLILLAVFFSAVRSMITAISGNNLNSWISLFVLSDVVFFPMMGYYVEHVLDIKKMNGKKAAICFVSIIGACLLGIVCTRMEAIRTGIANTEGYLNAFCCISAVAIYVLAKYYLEKYEPCNMVQRVIVFLGEATFGIYLLEVAVREWIYGPILGTLMPYLKTLPSCLVAVVCCVGVGSVIVWLLKKIPVLGKYI